MTITSHNFAGLETDLSLQRAWGLHFPGPPNARGDMNRVGLGQIESAQHGERIIFRVPLSKLNVTVREHERSAIDGIPARIVLREENRRADVDGNSRRSGARRTIGGATQLGLGSCTPPGQPPASRTR